MHAASCLCTQCKHVSSIQCFTKLILQSSTQCFTTVTPSLPLPSLDAPFGYPFAIIERKHKIIMKFANQTKKLTGFSLSLLEECLAHDLYNLQHSDHLEAGEQLLNRHAPSSKFHDFLCAAIFEQQIPKGQVWTATSAKLHNGASIHNKDFVLVSSTNACKWKVARMEHHFAVQGVVYSIVTFCTCIEYFYSSHSAQVQIQEQLQLTETSAILCPLIYADEERATRVFIPWAYRLSKG